MEPILRWPAIIHPAPSLFLGFPLPPEPPASGGLLPAPTPPGEAEPEADSAALAAVVAALQAADVSYL